MAAKDRRTATAKDRALDYVKTRVLTGEFPGGELISEGDVASALGMSRTPVREAFLRLEAEGLLRLYPQRGALVVPVSPDEVRAVMEARLVLEQFAAGKVIGRGAAACAAVFGRLSGELARQRDAAAAADWREFVEADRAFHAITLQESGNAILSGFYASLRDRQMRMIGESTLRDPDRVATILEEHRGIAEALRDGDRARAATAVQTHLAGTVRAIGLSVDPDPLWATGFGRDGAD
ncbi:GntR family transcriptional regulator [Mycobacterium intracellulare]|uniref:GntR family transcriptional regulator n=2 Tax=Mycobacterium intracellulare TaxID=1767 RepID=H8IPT9_MYCIA|nr:GntR family transcriptional regulator [Mycobacterium intracellulare]AFC45368.1 GntR family transcriptional regulator [Mycobacterium intracellulare ATCC 13950]AFC50521.1 GntR family transcriptional regulator [Mycobacterium intracellulare MOTT-02]MCA2247467.1 GntR family transcriptional regulator [Mycobacterium intracellulare]MDM3896601.1 GntR family transcriptional regulator [Mycobacterium intracellulare]MEE3802929.1 GntR family transcriptional regulator [Mycobacterium intracellulare]